MNHHIYSTTRRWLLKHEECYTNSCVVERDRFGGSTIVWGMTVGRHPIWSKDAPIVVINGNLNAVQYCDRILSTVVPYV